MTPPICRRIAVRPGPPAEIDIEVQDIDSGLLFVEVVHMDNAQVPVPPFEVHTNDPLVITATKVDPALASRVELRIYDVAGNSTLCDPITTQVIRSAGQPARESYYGLADEEDTVEVYNGSPGLKHLDIRVNGMSFHVAGLHDGEVRTIDISPAILPGDQNILTLTSAGKPGGSATIFISEGEEE